MKVRDEEFHDLLGEVEMHSDSQEEPLTLSVIDTIEQIFDRIADDLIEMRKHLTIELRTRPRTASSHYPALEHTEPQKRDILRYPGRTANEAWRFTTVVRILELIYEALRTGVVVSKRDIYYRDPALFGTQSHVDRCIDHIAYTCNVSRNQLNVSAAAKGLIAGAVSICRRDGSTIDASSDREGLLVPSLREILSTNQQQVKWVLVIEKEATFRSVTASRYWEIIKSEGIVITGKGYPDVATRAFLRYLSFPSPQNGFCSPPVYGLADYDPDGLAILLVYQNGSLALQHENEGLIVPQLRRLGLSREHLVNLSDDLHASQGLLELTERDRNKAKKMLERGREKELQITLQEMLLTNLKAELQILDASDSAMTNLLRSGLP